jgi:nicotinate-nucleotide--dimethylbenzimidazole phosphoribosyltransferase
MTQPAVPPFPLATPALDAVVFEAATLVEPPSPRADQPARSTPGARRLVDALVGRGVLVRVLADDAAGHGAAGHAANGNGAAAAAVTGGRAGGVRAHLSEAGLGNPGVAVLDAAAAAAESEPDRTLVVARTADRLAGTPLAGHPVATVDGRTVHRAVLDWLTGRAGPFVASALLCGPLDPDSVASARQRHLRLTKPPGSLGRLEAIGVQLAGIAGASPPPLPRPAAAAVFAGDHGVHAQGVSPWPQEVTTQMVANFLDGGAAINVLARQVGAEVVVVDVGVAGDLAPAACLVDRKVRRGTADLTIGPAMTPAEARRALDAGSEVAALLVDRGARCLVTGDMGIANTTPSAALIASLTDRPAAAVTGRGTGIDDELLTRKTALVAAAAARARYAHGGDALAILAEVGGLEHAALAGFVVGAAALQVPVIIDGVIAASALLVASRLVPAVEQGVIAGHRSVEPGSSAVLGTLGLDPMVDLGLRLGEGTGAALAVPLVEAAARVLHEMATFDQAGVTDKRR